VLTCKPNSVYLTVGQSVREIIIYLGLTSPSASSSLPASCRAGRSAAMGSDAAWPCTPRGLPGRPGHPDRRWALTPPFHPSPVPQRAIGWSTLCCTCRHSEYLRSAFPLGSAVPYGVRTFLTAGLVAARWSGQLAWNEKRRRGFPAAPSNWYVQWAD